jgi:hypothetical protein
MAVEQQILKEAQIRGRVAYIELWYPEVEPNVNTIELGLMCVRAADNIRITYDYDRDGYVVLQGSQDEWPDGAPEPDCDWQEVAFIKAWARYKNGSPNG